MATIRTTNDFLNAVPDPVLINLFWSPGAASYYLSMLAAKSSYLVTGASATFVSTLGELEFAASHQGFSTRDLPVDYSYREHKFKSDVLLYSDSTALTVGGAVRTAAWRRSPALSSVPGFTAAAAPRCHEHCSHEGALLTRLSVRLFRQNVARAV